MYKNGNKLPATKKKKEKKLCVNTFLICIFNQGMSILMEHFINMGNKFNQMKHFALIIDFYCSIQLCAFNHIITIGITK